MLVSKHFFVTVYLNDPSVQIRVYNYWFPCGEIVKHCLLMINFRCQTFFLPELNQLTFSVCGRIRAKLSHTSEKIRIPLVSQISRYVRSCLTIIRFVKFTLLRFHCEGVNKPALIIFTVC